MAYLDTTDRSAGFTTQFSDRSRRLIDRLRRLILLLQYARMIEVLVDMPDHVLDEIGISRSEIPSYARQLVYGPE